MPVLRGESQAFPQKRITSTCKTLFNIVFALKNNLRERLGAVTFF